MPTSDPGLPQLLVDWSQVVGSGIGALALILSLFALWKSKRDIAKERTRQFELDVLRDISDIQLTSHEAQPGSRLITKLTLLGCKDEDFPITRAALKVQALPEQQQRFDDGLRAALDARYEGNVSNGNWTEIQLRQVVDPQVDQWEQRWTHLMAPDDGRMVTVTRELNEAIMRRVKR